jgi:hypothetical protein
MMKVLKQLFKDSIVAHLGPPEKGHELTPEVGHVCR